MSSKAETKSNSINSTEPEKKTQTKNEIPINKYSIYELKSAIDTKIMEFLEKNGFVEDHYLSNLKIGAGVFCLFFTGLAYLYPKPFPENYNIVLLSVIMYIFGSVVYWYLEKYLIKQIFYAGFSESFVNKIRMGKREKLKLLKISSDIQEHSSNYEIWFDFVTNAGLKIQSEKSKIDCTQVCDEKGYIIREKVDEIFKTILTGEISKIN